MKTIKILTLALICATSLQAQTLNNDGLYVSDEGTLFTGKMVKMQNDNRVEMMVKDGKAEGPVFYFYPNGKLMETGFFVSNEKNDKWVRYNEKGGISAVAFYSAGKKSGTWLVYDDAGNKRLEMQYQDGQKVGIWTSWDESGKVASTKDYGKAY